MKIAIATKNLGKFNEFKELSVDTDYEFIQILALFKKCHLRMEHLSMPMR